MDDVTERFVELAHYIVDNVPPGREQSTALTKLDAPCTPKPRSPGTSRSNAMDVTVIVAASITSTRDTAEQATIGELADAVAETHALAGDAFTLKIDGEISPRDASTNQLTGTQVLELIEHVTPAENTDTDDATSSVAPDEQATATTIDPAENTDAEPAQG